MSSLGRVEGFRWSMLVALGLVPIACGGIASDGSANRQPGTSGDAGRAGHAPGGSASGAPGGRAGDGAGGSAGSLPIKPVCTPVGEATDGIVTCREGYAHREATTFCGVLSQGGQSGDELPRAGFSGHECAADQDCADYYLGYCYSDFEGAGGATTACLSGCATDADCPSGRICLCHPNGTPGGACVASNCVTDADCQTGYFCASYEQTCGENGFACQRPEDECTSSADCPTRACSAVAWSRYRDGGTERRTCDNVICGRPFLVQAEVRVAPTTATWDWAGDGVAPRLTDLSSHERAALAEHWTRMGQMEHASIAAFARFQLQLLSLGAPPTLVEACTQALADETRHTKLCFAFASAYAGEAIGPGALDVAHSLELTSLADIVDLVLAEGCFGETNAALDALEAAELATDPVVASAYSQIAEDERRHAELAFRFVRWALERDRESVATRITRALALPSGEAARSVTAPCLRALLAA